QTVSDGVGFINYTAHGSSTSWGDPSFTISNVNGLNNAGKYTLAVGNACLTAKFDVGTCFGEAWLRAANKGAIGYIGATNNTYWNEDVWWSTGYFSFVGNGVTPTFAQTTMGAYDAGFITSDLTTQSALTYVGNFAVTTAGASLAHYYWEVYELFGDPSLMIYWTEPEPLTAIYEEIIPVGSGSLEITIPGVENAMVALSYNGQKLAAGMTNSAGQLTLVFDEALSELGTYELLISAQNHIPYFAEIEVITPAIVSFEPDTAEILTDTGISFLVLDGDNQPMPDVQISAFGPGYESETVETDSAGQALLLVNFPYGPYVLVSGKRAADPFVLFTDTVWVAGGTDLSSPQISVSTDFGLADTLAIDLPGVIHASATEEGIKVAGGFSMDLLESDNADTLLITPNATGKMIVFLFKEGYNVYESSLPVIRATGALNGRVLSETGTFQSGAMIVGYQNGLKLFSVNSNEEGIFSYLNAINCGYLDLSVKKFGYDIIDTTIFLNYGANELEFTLYLADSSLVSGSVTDSMGNSIGASLTFYRNDNNQLYRVANTDSTGEFALHVINYEYLVKVRAAGYQMIDIVMAISEESNLNLMLKELITILLINADANLKFADRECTIFLGEDDKASTSANLLNEIFTAMGNEIKYENAANTNPLSWKNYRGVIFSKGDDRIKIPANLVSGLVTYVRDGGILLIEGGEIGWNHQSDALGREVLKISGFSGDDGGNISPYNSGHPLMTTPNLLPEIGHSYSGWGDQDVLTPADSNLMVASWTKSPSKMAMLAYENVVYLPFNFLAITDENDRYALAGNLARYLGFHSLPHNYPPQAFHLVSPADEYVWSDTMITEFSWTRAIDNEPVEYTLRIFNETFDTTISTMDISMLIDLNEVYLPSNETLHWYVMASDGANITESEETYDMTVTAIVSNKENSLLPQIFSLQQNYPNPFNPVTTVSYGIPEMAETHITIYNLLGEAVRSYQFGSQQPGLYSFEWAGANHYGRPVAAGIYLLVMESRSLNGQPLFRDMIKMVYLK
ncbi:MAG TPA: hypothetical protein ENN84_07345, partial [Candidatus Marinimicrobia bacterium]|nr:hypothetical protein [Candidatus Neomarinimicrobiota bacterium]